MQADTEQLDSILWTVLSWGALDTRPRNVFGQLYVIRPKGAERTKIVVREVGLSYHERCSVIAIPECLGAGDQVG